MLTLQSPAKINLFLRIIRRRLDGYHELASVFQTISLRDTLHFSFAEQDLLTCTENTIPTDGSNLVLKAASLFRRKTGLSFGLKIHIEKRIPSQAGLGGGSSNAATTLWGINQLLGKPYSVQNLMDWASEIGSDIPFFFSQGSAYCTGRGEIVQILPNLPLRSLWIIKPNFGLPTPMVYQTLDLSEVQERTPEQALVALLNHPETAENYFNDLELPAFRVAPQLKELREQLLSKGFHTAVMTGSGSAFFCFGSNRLSEQKTLFQEQAQFINRSSKDWYN